MEITSVNIKKSNKGGKLKAYSSVVFDNAFVVNGIKLVKGKNGLFVVMPNRKNKRGEYKDIAHPINSNMREMITKAVIDKYEGK